MPSFAFGEVYEKAWQAFEENRLDDASCLFAKISNESMRAEYGKIGLLAVEMKKQGADGNPQAFFQEIIQTHCACQHAWLAIAQSLQGTNPAAAKMAMEIAKSLAAS